jgi:glycogen debranching enzyme
MRWKLLLLAAQLSTPATAQTGPTGVPRFPFDADAVTLSGPARAGVYLGDEGRRAALLGEETGSFEVWTWPLKLVRNLELAFKVPEYDSPIPGSAVAREVTVRAAGATITYAHASFTVRQHLFVPLDEPGALMLLDVETVRPLEVLVQLRADFNLAWPGSFGGGYITWQPEERRFLLSQGGVRQYNGFIGSPFAEGGTTHPAHDAPMVPSQFTLRFDTARTSREYIPIVMAGGFERDSVSAVYARLLGYAERLWREKVAHYAAVRERQLTMTSPDTQLDLALEWAKVNLDQQLVCNPDLGCGLVAGFGRAGPGNFRPGFGWFFGGDAAINSLAMDGLGHFELVKQGLEFLAKYQRADGKITHEISQAAGRLPWFTDYPYTWFHGDTTPFWILACYHYWLASGDTEFVRAHWPAIVKAFRWSAATDRNGDALMENPSAGAGAIEVGGLGEALLTDIYLAGTWVASLEGVARLAEQLGDNRVRRDADQLYERAQGTLEDAFWLEPARRYAFALLLPAGDGGPPRLNDALTVWPATAMSFSLLDPERADPMLREIGSAALTADWGARLLARGHRLYDPLHYNNGAVWPFMTGFVALAHFRYHRGWAGWDLVRDIARTTFDYALGRNPELMSGAFYRPLDTAVPQQFFGTAMMTSALVRGLLGLEADAPNQAVAIEPHLPAEWDSITIESFRVGSSRLGMTVVRNGGSYQVDLRHQGAAALRVRLSPALPLGARVQQVTVQGREVPLQIEETAHDVHPVVELTVDDQAQVEIEYSGGVEVLAPAETVKVGDSPASARILDFRKDGDEYLLLVEGLSGRRYDIMLRAGGVAAVQRATVLPAASGLVRLGVDIPASPAEYGRVEVRFRS